MDTGGIGVSNLPNQRYQILFGKKMDYNIMVVGASGLGKTTFLNMLLDTDKIPYSCFELDLKTPAKHYMFSKGELEEAYAAEDNPSWYKEGVVNFQKYTTVITERGFSINLSLVEVGGFGDCICNDQAWDPIEQYIKKQFAIYQNHEADASRMDITDTRVHACLFFLEPSPSNLRYLDLCTMKKISKLCNLVPVVAKSDLLSHDMIQKHYEHISNQMKAHGIQFFGIEDYEKIEGCEMPPYFLTSIARNSEGEYVREYPWGSIHMDSPCLKDFFSLRDLLVKKGFCELKESTEHFYAAYRTNQLIEKHNLDHELLERHKEAAADEKVGENPVPDS